ncbi:hypothetical protein GQ43DRAFT_443797 [Delitschia confertaspora ATCC 74209]|uniref:Histone chaperone domain-containing protein n=1 Tax=Delitschia confertaspora ATCC 74209 TaxID=1513339 RepID=A0A9P4MVE1_9PLEO|nr:hypothetical protein GQ43DRAFT_443797 [Delitschia confertaspora ATCC 74209]
MSNQSTDHRMEDAEMTGAGNTAPLDKGKGKAPQEQTMEETDDSSSEESGAEDQTIEDIEEEDNMEEIDTNNIITNGRRTRGKNIDFTKAAQELPEEEDDDDEDFQEPAGEAMEE